MERVALPLLGKKLQVQLVYLPVWTLSWRNKEQGGGGGGKGKKQKRGWGGGPQGGG